VKRLAAAFALSALAAATVGLAQQAAQQASTQPPATTGQAPPPSDSSSSANQAPSEQSLMKDCMSQVQAANPNVPPKDIQVYCEDQVKTLTSKPN
jgi:hypothetical protein